MDINLFSYFGYSTTIVDKLETSNVPVRNKIIKIRTTRIIVDMPHGILHLFFKNWITGRSAKEKNIAVITGSSTELKVLQINPIRIREINSNTI